ncbi:MAG: 5-oxoprolinase/urea amidolyase family protein [Dermatophilaceae bacterium]
MRVLPCGPDALLLEFEDGAQARAFRAGWEAVADPDEDVETVPAARTLLVRGAGPGAGARLRERIRTVEPREQGVLVERDVVIVDVVYDGPDLGDVADVLGCSPEAFVARHTQLTWTVEFCGFSPGFAYLTCPGAGWSIPRLTSPRPRVPRGSVAVAGEYSACYPTASPGGWRLVGTTDAVLWDAGADPPALLTPGTRVRFADVTAHPPPVAPQVSATPHPVMRASTHEIQAITGVPAETHEECGLRPSGSSGPRLVVVASGPRTLVEDLGRAGLAALGVGPSGAADRSAHRLANRLLGNDEAAATLEVLAGGLAVRALEPTVVAVAGAPVPCAVDGRPVAFAEPVFLPSGATLRLGNPESGLRSYVAVLGGVASPPVLGSRSFDTIAGLGPAPLRAGQVLATGSHAVRTADTGIVGFAVGPDSGLAETTGAGRDVAAAASHVPVGGGPVTMGATWGPRADWFTPVARDLLRRATWLVEADSDRVGVRCAGPALARLIAGELASEPVVRGSVQVPPSGRPVVFLADHPTTGGYPVIAVLDPGAVDTLAQLRPGDSLRIAVRSPAYATDLQC